MCYHNVDYLRGEKMIERKYLVIGLTILFVVFLAAAISKLSYSGSSRYIHYSIYEDNTNTNNENPSENRSFRIPKIDFINFVDITNNISEKINNFGKIHNSTIDIEDKKEDNSEIIIDERVLDNIPPTIKLINCSKEQYIAIKDSVKYCNYEVTDNIDEDINNKVTVTSDVNTKKRGNYKITYTVTDSSGNTSSETVKVYVRKKSEMTYIKISISKQRLVYYKDRKKVLSTPVTTGRNNATRKGTFKVWNKVRDTELKGKDYVSRVRYWMAYDGNSFGIHDASWRSRFGGQDYKWNGSHGCVNVPTKAMAKLYKLVEVGTTVYIVK